MRDPEARPTQAAVIPVRRTATGLQVCLIRRTSAATWSVPKGFIERGDDWAQAGLGEAREEAGLSGRILGEAIGTYDYEKGPLTLTVAVGVMEVFEELASWDEMRWRERRWCSVEEAGVLLAGHPVWPLYDRLRPTLTAMSSNTPRQMADVPSLRIGSIVIHCFEFRRMLDFWSATLGYAPKYPPTDDWVILTDPNGAGPNLSLQARDRGADHRSWFHLDLYAANQTAEVERLVGLGARRYPWRYEPGADYVVLEDPDGNLFCVVEAGDKVES